MNIRKLSDLKESDLTGKKVFVRMDFDVPEGDFTRIEASLPTLKFLIENKAKLLLIGHKGRPGGVFVEEKSMKNLVEPLKNLLGTNIEFVADFKKFNPDSGSQVYLFENLRFDPGEESNDKDFSKSMASLADIYVNEAFATSHRAHASFVGITEFLPSYAGLRLVSEIEHLSKVLESPARPVVFLVSGIKEDKVEMIKKIKEISDKTLVGGRLPELIETKPENEPLLTDPKVMLAKLNPDKEDITIHSIEKFEEQVKSAGTIVLGGVMGRYEDEGQRLGTERVFKAISESSAYKVAGGGDTEATLTQMDLKDKFDWISVGGGAMLAFLAGEKLPGIEVLRI